jgi:hypothetical protein
MYRWAWTSKETTLSRQDMGRMQKNLRLLEVNTGAVRSNTGE